MGAQLNKGSLGLHSNVTIPGDDPDEFQQMQFTECCLGTAD